MAMKRQHGTPVILKNPAGTDTSPLTLIRSETPPFTEDGLQELLARNPSMLPIDEIEPAFAPLVCLGREITTAVGPLDILYASPSGYLTLVETKLWKNSQSRREVVGQIIDYAKELAKWSFDDLDEGVQAAQRRQGKQAEPIVSLIRQQHPDFSQDTFHDTVSKSLKRGQFLLVIAGDGIHAGVENITEYLQRFPSLHFSIALVEFALYHLDPPHPWPILVQPRTIARTTEILRAIVDVRLPDGMRVDVTLPSEGKRGASITLTEQAFYQQLADNVGVATAGQIRELCDALEGMGLLKKWNPATLSLRYPTDKREFTVLVIQTNGQFYLGWLNQVTKSGYDSQIATRYLKGVIELAGALPSGEDATRATAISSLLVKKDAFLALVREFTDSLLAARQLEPE